LVNIWRILPRRTVLSLADSVVTSPLVRWTWTGLAEEKFLQALPEYRPTDRETVLEMMAGRYLLAFKLVDTHGVSPFSVADADPDWFDDLQSFSWLRHFRDARDEGERRFARTLVTDWISRDGQFDSQTWSLVLCAQRVLNWLRHFPLIVEGASPEQVNTISRVLGSQIQSLKFRSTLSHDPVETLMSAMALVGVSLCLENAEKDFPERIAQLEKLLEAHIDEDGLHRSRSARTQLMLLTELETIRMALDQRRDEALHTIAPIIESMHQALHAITLGTGEPGYFHDCGQLPHDLLVAVQAQSPSRPRRNIALGGYGLISAGPSIVMADSGQVPPPEFAARSHASALAFEFSYGSELICGSCGPAPANLPDSRLLFRQGIAHTAPTINAISAASIPARGPFAGRVMLKGEQPQFHVDPANLSIKMASDGWRARFGVDVERRLSLIADGKTLVGQDRFLGRRNKVSGVCTLRFHLAPGSDLRRSPEEELLRLRLQSGQVWTFLWEGAEMRVEDSVRQSAYFGFHRTRQIVLEAAVEDGAEIAWIFTRQEG